MSAVQPIVVLNPDGQTSIAISAASVANEEENVTSNGNSSSPADQSAGQRRSNEFLDYDMTSMVVLGVDGSGVQIGRFSSGLFDCFHNLVPSFWMSTCFPCVMYGQILQRSNLGRFYSGVTLYAIFYIPLLLYLLGAPFGQFVLPLICTLAFLIYSLRGNFRRRFNIPGTQSDDFYSACFCPCLSLSQMARHVFRYGISGGASVPATCSFLPPQPLPIVRRIIRAPGNIPSGMVVVGAPPQHQQQQQQPQPPHPQLPPQPQLQMVQGQQQPSQQYVLPMGGQIPVGVASQPRRSDNAVLHV